MPPTPEAPKPDGTPEVPSLPSTPAAPPPIAPPSATVEPFDAVGQPPPPPPRPRKSPAPAIITALLLLIAGGVGYYLYQNGTLNQYGFGPKKAATTVTPTPKAGTDELDQSFQAVDTSLGDLDANLTNVDTVLGDKQGDLTE
jgi:hypothetical protein